MTDTRTIIRDKCSLAITYAEDGAYRRASELLQEAADAAKAQYHRNEAATIAHKEELVKQEGVTGRTATDFVVDEGAFMGKPAIIGPKAKAGDRLVSAYNGGIVAYIVKAVHADGRFDVVVEGFEHLRYDHQPAHLFRKPDVEQVPAAPQWQVDESGTWRHSSGKLIVEFSHRLNKWYIMRRADSDSLLFTVRTRGGDRIRSFSSAEWAMKAADKLNH